MSSVTALSNDTFDREVLEASTPVLVDYWAEWCAPCRAFRPVVEEAAGEYAGRIKFTQLNVDENPDLAAQYRIRSIPTLMLFREGRVVAQHVGTFTRDQLGAFIDQNL